MPVVLLWPHGNKSLTNRTRLAIWVATKMRAMNIQSTKRFVRVQRSKAPSSSAPSTEPSTGSSRPEGPKPPVPSWRQITLNEAAVEIPQSVLELSKLERHTPVLAKGLQGAVAGLAGLRAAQCFHDAKSVEEVLEGLSSGALAVASGATLFPGATAGLVHQGFLVGHGATELALGVREVAEELRKDKPARLELAAGVLDTIKGASTFIPMLFPETSDVVNIFQIGAITTKTVMEPFMERHSQS